MEFEKINNREFVTLKFPEDDYGYFSYNHYLNETDFYYNEHYIKQGDLREELEKANNIQEAITIFFQNKNDWKLGLKKLNKIDFKKLYKNFFKD